MQVTHVATKSSLQWKQKDPRAGGLGWGECQRGAHPEEILLEKVVLEVEWCAVQGVKVC
jgi:hypothetical protein